MGAFDDLIPAGARAAAPMPASNPFADLIPAARAAPQSAAGGDFTDPGDISALTTGGVGPDGRLKNELSVGGAARGLNNAVGALASGIPFADRLSAAGAAATGLGGHFGDYAGALADLHGIDAARAAADPAAEKVGNLVGGAGAMLAAPVSVTGALPEGAGLMARILTGGGDGAVFGGVQGASDAPDLTNVSDVAGRVKQGAEMGLVAGGLTPALGAVASKGYQLARGLMADAPAGINRYTAALLDTASTPAAMANLDRLGPNSIAADASPSMTGLAQGVAAKGSPSSDQLVEALNARYAAQPDRLLADRNSALGPAISPQQMGAALDKSGTVSPLLDQAYANNPGPMWNPDLAGLADRPAVAKAIRSASDTAANAGNPLPTVVLDDSGQQVTPAARAAYDAYQADAVPRTQNALADLLGSGGTLGTSDQVMAQRAAEAGPLYDQFRASDIPLNHDLSDLLKRPSVAGALPSAQRLARDEGKSIFAPGSTADLDPAAETPIGEPPDRTAPPPVEAYADRITPQRPSVPRPQTLQDFVKSAGGIQDKGGDLKAMGFDAVRGMIAKPGSGLSVDAMRQAAAQGGYLGADIDHAMASTTPNDLFDALERHPVHSARDGEAAAQWAGYDNARSDAATVGNGGSVAGPRPGGASTEGLEPGGEVTPPVRKLTPEGWDYVKRALDDKISTAQRGGSNNEARVYTGLKNQITAALDRAAPVYGQARQTFAGHSALLDALEAGGNAVKPATSREQVQREFAALGTDGEREMYRLGAGNSLRELVAKRGDDADLARSIRGNLAMRDKLATLSPSEDALQRFNGTLDAQSQSFDEAMRPDVRGWKLARDNLREQQGRATGDQAKAIGAAADTLDQHLHAIPELLRADMAQQASTKAQAAFDRGRTVLRGGDDQPWPADLSAEFDKLPLEQQAALRAGARSDIEQRFGQNRNDMAALARLLGDTNDVNRAHMGTLFGDSAGKAMGDALAREQTFQATRNAVTQGSRTAPMREASRSIDDATAPREYFVPKEASVGGMIGHAVESLIRNGAGLVSRNANTATREQLARMLSLSGPEFQAAMAARQDPQGAILARALQALQPAAVPALIDARRGP